MKLHSRPAGHFYIERRLFYPSVTTILHQIPNPCLENWKKNTSNWRKISTRAAKIGTEIHKEVEYTLMHKPITIKYPIQLAAFREWQKEIGFHALKTEVKVKSARGFAGSLDILGTINGDLFIVDLKTSKQLYPEMLLQLSAYLFAFKEQNILLDVNIGVLKVDKNKKQVEWHPYSEEEYQNGITEFLALCEQWHEEHDVKQEYNKKFILED